MRSTSSAQVGRSVIRPPTTPVAITPWSGSPSTTAFWIIIGAEAAIMAWVRVRPPWARIPWAARSSSGQEAPVWRFMASPLSKARSHMPTGPDRSIRSSKGVRTIRCGMPSSLVVRTISSVPAFRYRSLLASGTGLSQVSRKRVPMAIPTAP
jgi:hypothetical protein